MLIKQFAVQDHKVKAVIYGASGTGKTTFAGTAKNSIFASAEKGLLSIADKKPNYVDIKSLKDLKDLLQYLSTEKHNFETVIIDSVTEINDIIKQDIEKKTGRPMQLQDWGTLSKEIKGLFKGFRDLPMHVLFLAQETSEKDEDVVVKIVPSLNGKAATEIAYFMDIVGYIFIDKAGQRKIITNATAKLLTKDRSNKIGNEAPLDFQEWIDKVNTITLGEEKTVTDFNGSAPSAPVTPPSPVKGSFYTMVKNALSKTTTQKQALETIEKLKNTDKVSNEERAELIALYEEKAKSLTPAVAQTQAVETPAVAEPVEAVAEEEVAVEEVGTKKSKKTK